MCRSPGSCSHSAVIVPPRAESAGERLAQRGDPGAPANAGPASAPAAADHRSAPASAHRARAIERGSTPGGGGKPARPSSVEHRAEAVKILRERGSPDIRLGWAPSRASNSRAFSTAVEAGRVGRAVSSKLASRRRPAAPAEYWPAALAASRSSLAAGRLQRLTDLENNSRSANTRVERRRWPAHIPGASARSKTRRHQVVAAALYRGALHHRQDVRRLSRAASRAASRSGWTRSSRCGAGYAAAPGAPASGAWPR